MAWTKDVRLVRGLRAPTTRGPCRRARSTRRSRAARTTSAVGLELSLGTQATDRMVGEPTTFTKAWFDAWPDADDAMPVLVRGPRASRPSRRSSACGSRTRSARPRWSTCARADRARHEGERGGCALAGLRARRGHRLAGRASSSRSASRSSGPGRGIKTFTATGDRPVVEATSRRCSRSGSAPTATGPTTRSCSASASCATTTASSRQGLLAVYGRAIDALRARREHGRARPCSCATASTELGYPGQPSHPICHGVGARAHEPPYAHQAGGGTIEEGMVLAIEPGCYWEGGGGLRVEDNFLITDDGRREALVLPGWSGAMSDADLDRLAERRVRGSVGSVGLYDTTLRDGEQTVGVVLDPDAEARDRAAARRARRSTGSRLASRASPHDDWQAVEQIAAAGLRAEVWGFSRAVPADLEALVELGVSFSVIESPISDLKLDGDRRLAREDARPHHERDALRRRARHPRRVLRRRLDARRARRSTTASTSSAVEAGREGGRRRRHARDRLARGGRRARRHDGRARRRSAGALPRPQRLRCRDRARPLRRCARAPRYVHGTINGMGERAGNANLGEVALTLRALYGVESNLRLDRIRDVSARVRELSGYELEPWKPVTGDTLYRRESGAVASQFHDPPSIEPYSSELVATERVDRARQEERARLDPHQGRRARPRRARGTARRGARGGEEARRAEARASSPTTSSGESLADHDAIIVGSGDQRARVRARCSREAAGTSACSSGTTGSAVRSRRRRSPCPGFQHDVFSAWHPLWVGGAAHAQLGDELARTASST